MNELHQKSLALIEKYFEEISDEEFLKQYNELEKGIGPTVEEWLENNVVQIEKI